MSIDNSEEFDTSKLFIENEEEDDDETETTSPGIVSWSYKYKHMFITMFNYRRRWEGWEVQEEDKEFEEARET